MGPEVTPRPDKSYPALTVSAYKGLYKIPEAKESAAINIEIGNLTLSEPDELTRRPHLLLCQNAGLQHGPDFKNWLPTLQDAARVSLPCAFTMFDGGEFERSLLYCEFCQVPSVHAMLAEKPLYRGVNPYRSIFYGCFQGTGVGGDDPDIFSINHHIIVAGKA